MWNGELFFEVHDWLEEKWLKSSGREREILQALIRAAGTYLLLRHGRTSGATKMAARAVAALEEHRAAMGDHVDVDRLISKLATLDPVPPRFTEL